MGSKCSSKRLITRYPYLIAFRGIEFHPSKDVLFTSRTYTIKKANSGF